MTNIPEHYLGLAFVALLVLLVFVGLDDHDEAVLAEAHYCKMVKLFNDTGGTHGWPDYEKKADACYAQNDD